MKVKDIISVLSLKDPEMDLGEPHPQWKEISPVKLIDLMEIQDWLHKKAAKLTGECEEIEQAEYEARGYTVELIFHYLMDDIGKGELCEELGVYPAYKKAERIASKRLEAKKEEKRDE